MAPNIRGLIDKALATRGTDLETFVTVRKAEGKSVTDIADDLNLVTGIPITSRTLYRWLEDIDLEVAS